MASIAATQSIQCVIVTPERAVLDETCEFVAVPMFDGELGILPGRVPMIGRLGYGELRTRKGNAVHRYYVDGGFVQVKEGLVTVLTSKAIKAADINVVAVQKSLESAQKLASDEHSLAAQLQTQLRARAQLRVARHAAEAGPNLTLENA